MPLWCPFIEKSVDRLPVAWLWRSESAPTVRPAVCGRLWPSVAVLRQRSAGAGGGLLSAPVVRPWCCWCWWWFAICARGVPVVCPWWCWCARAAAVRAAAVRAAAVRGAAVRGAVRCCLRPRSAECPPCPQKNFSAQQFSSVRMADLLFSCLAALHRFYIKSNTKVTPVTVFVLPNPGRGALERFQKVLKNFCRFFKKTC